MSLIRCNICVMPNRRPDVPFVDGTCQACLTYKARPTIDWEQRRTALLELLDRHHGECVVASSGGKDSHYQVLKLIELGANVTIVTATTCHLTPIGRANIDNLARYATTIEITPNRTVRRKLNRLGLHLVGDISWPEHVAIFTVPLNTATQLGRTLLFYGENPQNQYGGPPGTERELMMTQRWRAEFGGFLGLRPADMVGLEQITNRDMEDYCMQDTDYTNLEAHFLGQYLPWDSHENARIALQAGMTFELPTAANWWAWENLDNAQTGLHDYLMALKYGYGRGCTQISVDVRAGRVSRAEALEWVKRHDGLIPYPYAGVSLAEVLDPIGVTPAELKDVQDRFTVGQPFWLAEDAG